MSLAPQTLLDLRIDLAAIFQVDKSNFGITGVVTASRPWGYHLGEADIFGEGGMGWNDYSVRHARDKAGLTNASAGFDLRLKVGILKKMAAFLVEEARAGRTNLIVEVLGPDADGNAMRWALDNGWKPQPARADHEWHIHVSFFRDTEFTDKRPLFRQFAQSIGILLPEIPPEGTSPVKALTNIVELQRGTVGGGTPVLHPETLKKLFEINTKTVVKLFGVTQDGMYRGIMARTSGIEGPNPKIALVPAARVSEIHVIDPAAPVKADLEAANATLASTTESLTQTQTQLTETQSSLATAQMSLANTEAELTETETELQVVKDLSAQDVADAYNIVERHG